VNKNIKILIVDDSFSMRKIITNILKTLGLNDVEGAENGHKAFVILKKYHPDIILLDWNMPVMDGYEFLTKIKANDELKSIPVLMVTSVAEKLKVIEAIKAGACDYVTKPFTADTIKEKLDKHIKK